MATLATAAENAAFDHPDGMDRWMDELDRIGLSTTPPMVDALETLCDEAPPGVDPDLIAELRERVSRCREPVETLGDPLAQEAIARWMAEMREVPLPVDPCRTDLLDGIEALCDRAPPGVDPDLISELRERVRHGRRGEVWPWSA